MRFLLVLTFVWVGFVASGELVAKEKSKPSFNVGFAKQDITPPPGLPMWGYGARHDMPSEGTLTKLFAKAVVIQAGDEKLAIVGLDLGRGPTTAMMTVIREKIEQQAGIKNVLCAGTHTHHAPCIELIDRDGFGKGKFDMAVKYNAELQQSIIDIILQADKNAQPAKLGVISKDVPLNRNRQSKRKPKAVDQMLGLLRFDDLQGKPIVMMVNFAAHPVMTDGKILKYSADFPGFLEEAVESKFETNCVFMQGASGDLSPNPAQSFRNVKAYALQLADHVYELAEKVETVIPERPSVRGKVHRKTFESRINFQSPLVKMTYSQAFFPELINCFFEEQQEGIPVEMNSILLNGEIALVGGSGEFFCNHSNRLKERAYFPHTFFFGYCNGHSMYFPTIEAVSEGGYGADAAVSPASIGAGEELMNQTLIDLYQMSGKMVVLKKK